MKFRTLAPVLLLGLAAPHVLAKMPAPSPEAQAKADEAKAKTAWTDKVAAFQLCRAMDRVADNHVKSAKAAGREASAPVATPPCSDPGAYVSPMAASAPPATATAPPSSKATQAQLQGTKQK